MIAVSPSGTQVADTPRSSRSARGTRKRPSSSLARRYAMPTAVALAVHAAVLFWPGLRTAPYGTSHGSVQAGEPSSEVAFVGTQLSGVPSAAKAADTSRAETQPRTSNASEALEFRPRPPLFPRPDFTALVELPPLETPLDEGSLTAAFRDAAPAIGLGYGASATPMYGGEASRRNTARRGEANGRADVYEIAQLDCEPALLRVPEFQFPRQLSRQGIHAGRVTVVVRVNADGRVSLLSIAESSHPDLIPAVSEAVEKALFQAPLRQGRRVALRYSWTLELKDRTQVAERSSS